MSRVVVWFSCGVPSACAAKLAVEKYGKRVEVVYCDLSRNEHIDNIRFRHEVEGWIGQSVNVISSAKYMSGIAGAPCTVEMKKVPRFQFQHVDDLNIFGFTSDERAGRVETFVRMNPELNLEWILRDSKMTRADCEEMVIRAGIPLPAMYLLGYKNNNCIGCVKATSPAYWNKTRIDFPEQFAQRAEQSRRLGVRLVRVAGKRIFLDELKPTDHIRKIKESISCGPDCR